MDANGFQVLVLPTCCAALLGMAGGALASWLIQGLDLLITRPGEACRRPGTPVEFEGLDCFAGRGRLGAAWASSLAISRPSPGLAGRRPRRASAADLNAPGGEVRSRAERRPRPADESPPWPGMAS